VSARTGGEPLRPALRLLSADLVGRILDEAYELLRDPGIRVQDAEALGLLAAAGARVEGEIARLPTQLVEVRSRPFPRRSTSSTGPAPRPSATAPAPSTSIPAPRA